jgi:RNase P subunit RPR2
MVAGGILLREHTLLRTWTHLDDDCHLVRRGRKPVELTTTVGKVRVDRQRLFCKRCREWITPLNEELGLHEQGNGRLTRSFREMACECGSTQPYRQAQRMLGRITHDASVTSAKQVQRVVGREGSRLRAAEDEQYAAVSSTIVTDVQDRNPLPKPIEGALYIVADGIWVRSCLGKGRWREGKVARICTEEREAVGRKGRRRVVDSRYVSSFKPADVFSERVWVDAMRMGYGSRRQVIVLGGGARWIPSMRRRYFPKGIYVLDSFRLRRRVARKLRRVVPEKSRQRVRWYMDIRNDLWEGRKAVAFSKLQRLHDETSARARMENPVAARGPDGLADLLGYLYNNWQGVIDYGRARDAGHMVPSSLVEKAGDLVVAKRQKKRQGMHWSHRGSEAVSALLEFRARSALVTG